MVNTRHKLSQKWLWAVAVGVCLFVPGAVQTWWGFVGVNGAITYRMAIHATQTGTHGSLLLLISGLCLTFGALWKEGAGHRSGKVNATPIKQS